MLKRNSWCAPWRFDTKQTEKLIKLTAKYINSVLQPILSLKLARCFAQWLYMYSSLFYSWKNWFLNSSTFGDIMYFIHTFTWLLWRKETILTKSLYYGKALINLHPSANFSLKWQGYPDLVTRDSATFKLLKVLKQYIFNEL